jgi:hypothetical protein
MALGVDRIVVAFGWHGHKRRRAIARAKIDPT